MRRTLTRLRQMVFRRHSLRIWGLPRSRFDYLKEVGDGTGSSTVMAPLLWIARTFPEAPLAVWKVLEDGQEEEDRKHELLRLIRRPNKHYTGRVLWMATVLDYFADGNAYWLKVRSETGRVTELWWTPTWTIEPEVDPDSTATTDFIHHYAYRPADGQEIWLRPEDVVHFRFGLDPDDPRKGRSPLKSVLREVFTDDEAANFTAHLLRNAGVPGLVVSPEGDIAPSEDDVQETKKYLSEAFTGDKRGEPLVMSGPTKVQQLGWSPEQLNLRDLRRIPEERVSAVLGVPAIVAGLGAGLDRSTFTNYTEAREAAYEQNIIPTQGSMGEEVQFQLLADFERGEGVWDFRVGFDLAKVRVLQSDEKALAERLAAEVRGGFTRVSEARRQLGRPVDASDEVYLRPMSTVEVAVGAEPRERSEETEPPMPVEVVASVNGNGA